MRVPPPQSHKFWTGKFLRRGFLLLASGVLFGAHCFAEEQFLLIPSGGPDPWRPKDYNHNTIDGVLAPKGKKPAKVSTGAAGEAKAATTEEEKDPATDPGTQGTEETAEKTDAGEGCVEMRGYTTSMPTSLIPRSSVFTPKTMPPKAEETASKGESRSLVAFYAVKTQGEARRVQFTSLLTMPNGNIESKEMVAQVPGDGKIRLVPLFFGMDVSQTAAPGQYAIHWTVTDAESGHYDKASAKFLSVVRGEGGKVDPKNKKWMGVVKEAAEPVFESRTGVPLATPPAKRFDSQGVGVTEKEKTEYTFEGGKGAPPAPARPKNDDRFRTKAVDRVDPKATPPRKGRN